MKPPLRHPLKTGVSRVVLVIARLGCVVCLGLSSCASGVVVGKGFYYPPSFRVVKIDHGDGTCGFDDSGALYRVYVTSHGTVGKDEAVHWRIEVTFATLGQPLGGSYHYLFQAFQLAEELDWHAPGDCTLHVYALPDGVFESDQNAKVRRAEVLRKRYRLDRRTNAFLEVF